MNKNKYKKANTRSTPSHRRAVAIVKDILSKRSCGSCQECCDAVAVFQIGKGEYTRCEHQCATGCAIYGKHPEACRTYHCMWRMDLMPESEVWRPDNLRAIFDLDENTNKLPYIRCWQLDSPTQILDDYHIRLAAYNLSVSLAYPVLGYYRDNQRSVHLIQPLMKLKVMFDKHPDPDMRYPVYQLTKPSLLNFTPTEN